MDPDHGEQLVRQGAFSAVDSIVEHGDVVDLQPVGGRDGFRFQPVDLVDHEVDGRGLQGLATERGGEPDLHPVAVLGVCLDGLRFVEGEADEVAEADAGEPSQIRHGGFDAGLARAGRCPSWHARRRFGQARSDRPSGQRANPSR